VNLGTSGCNVSNIQFSAFAVLPGLTAGTTVDPARVSVTPGGSAANPALSFTLNRTATAGESFEFFIKFSVSNSLSGISLGLTPPAVSGDAAVAAVLDVCPGGLPTGGGPFDCPASPSSLLLFAINGSSLLSNSASFPISTPSDVLIDLTVDGGTSGSATLGSATVGFVSVPEPSAGLLMAMGLAALALWRVWRGISSVIVRGIR
jgi:hypothetical protein